jgi:tetratricopeptide (TPR) repeat protein
MTSYDELIQKFPTSEVGYANKAFCLTVLGSYNEVENLFKTALNLNENNWKTHLYFGYFLGKLKRYEQSLKSL